jgi:small ligand-binding sensory domain FIST
MEIINRTSRARTNDEVIRDLMAETSGTYDLGILFFSAIGQSAIDDILTGLSQMDIKNLVGCTGAGIVSTFEEVEGEPAVSLMLARLPGVTIRPFSINQPQLESLTKPDDWYKYLEVFPNENPVFLLFPDPFNLNLSKMLSGMNQAYPKCPVIGGIASASMEPNGNTLILNDEILTEGAVGLSLNGNLVVDTVVSQGCRPIGNTFIVTKAEENIIHEIAGQKFFQILSDVLEGSSDRDRALAQEALFIGIATNEYKHELKRGDFLIRGLMGVDEKTGSGYIGDYIHAGQTVQFHVRDAQSATEDLNELLTRQKAMGVKKPSGALLFSCNGRGEHLFRQKNHDIGIFQNHMGSIPVGGFFCAGEIGPIGNYNFLHGFTDSIALFYPKT